jgi:hypothetical protein
MASLENVIGEVEVSRVEPGVPDRVVGRVVRLDLPRRSPLPVLGGHDAA